MAEINQETKLLSSPFVCSHTKTASIMPFGREAEESGAVGCLECLAIIVSETGRSKKETFEAIAIINEIDDYVYFGNGLALNREYHSEAFN